MEAQNNSEFLSAFPAIKFRVNFSLVRFDFGYCVAEFPHSGAIWRGFTLIFPSMDTASLWLGTSCSMRTAHSTAHRFSWAPCNALFCAWRCSSRYERGATLARKRALSYSKASAKSFCQHSSILWICFLRLAIYQRTSCCMACSFVCTSSLRFRKAELLGFWSIVIGCDSKSSSTQ